MSTVCIIGETWRLWFLDTGLHGHAWVVESGLSRSDAAREFLLKVSPSLADSCWAQGMIHDLSVEGISVTMEVEVSRWKRGHT